MPFVMLILSVVVLVSALLTLAVVTRLCGRGEEGIGERASKPEGDALRPFIVFGAFYANPDDPRGWVPKTTGVGTTLNLRTRTLAAVYFVAICGAAAGGIGLAMSVVLMLPGLG